MPIELSQIKSLLDDITTSGLDPADYISGLEDEIAEAQWKIDQVRRLLAVQEDRTPTGRRRRKDRGKKRLTARQEQKMIEQALEDVQVDDAADTDATTDPPSET